MKDRRCAPPPPPPTVKKELALLACLYRNEVLDLCDMVGRTIVALAEELARSLRDIAVYARRHYHHH